MTKTMTAVRVDAFGGPEALTVVEVPVPEPGPGQVRIRVEAASVNFSDVMRRRASPYPFPTPLPYFPGAEVAGTVDALGGGVEGPAVGTHVMALVGSGGESGYAQYALCDASRAAPIPPGLSPDVACGLLVAGPTAVLVVEDAARLGAGETVYVPAAAGGVGSLIVQIAKHKGATVLAGASTEVKRARALALGAEHAVDSSGAWDAALKEHAPRGLDAVLEMAGGEAFERGLACLAPFGRMVVYGTAGPEPRTLRPSALHHLLTAPALGGSVVAFNLGLYFGLRPARVQAALQTMVALVLKGAVIPHVGLVLPLRAVREAHRLLESRASVGKIVLDPWAR